MSRGERQLNGIAIDPLGLSAVPRPVLLHLLFETCAFAAGFALYRRQQKRHRDVIATSDRWSLLTAAILGALVGAKVLHHLAHPASWSAIAANPQLLLGGKTIVGALLGGWMTVEGAKRWLGIRERTGDIYVLPLAAGIAIGRIGCFFGGLFDTTFGLPTGLPWGVDFGDGVARHPTQLYEVGAVLLLAAVVLRPMSLPPPGGARFRAFILGYCAWRLAIDSLKPREPLVAGLDAIQLACLLALLVQWREVASSLRLFMTGRLTLVPPGDTA